MNPQPLQALHHTPHKSLVCRLNFNRGLGPEESKDVYITKVPTTLIEHELFWS